MRNAAQGGNISLFDKANGRNTTATLTLSNGGRLALDGAAAPAQQSGLRVGVRGGAFLSIGRNDSAPGASGTVSVVGGGKVEIGMLGVVSANASLLGGFYVGYGVGASGALTVAATGSLNGAPSSFAARGGTGFAPYGAVGRDGGSRTATLSGGGQLAIESAHASDPNATANTSGNSVVFDIGRNNTAGLLASTGTVTISGGGSALTLGGMADNYLEVGRGAGGNGTLNVLAGGSVSALNLQVGRDAGSVGRLNMSGGVLSLSGMFTSGVVKGRGAIFNLGHAGAIASANIDAGSVVNVSSDTGLTPAFTVGGSLKNPGGTGTLTLSGGSVISVAGNAAAIRLGHTATDAANPGVAVATLSGAGTRLSATGGSSGVAGNIVIGSGVFSNGVVTIGAGALMATDGFVGVAHSGTGSTGGSGVLIVNGTVTAPNLYIGSGGVLGGSGLISGNGVNAGGIVSPGQSPGT